MVLFRTDLSEEGRESNEFLTRLRETPRDQIFDSYSETGLSEFDDWVDRRQADWWLLGDTPTGVVVDLSDEYGGLSITMAEQAAAVLLLSTCRNRLKAAGIVAEKFDLDSVVPVYIPESGIPVNSSSVERVFLTGLADTGGNSLDASRLRQASELLVEGGEVHVRVKNRYDVRRVVRSAPSSFEDLFRLQPATARRLASHFVDPPEVDVWSRGEARTELAEAGFEDVAVSYGVPDERRPQYLFSDEAALTNYLRSPVAQQCSVRSKSAAAVIRLGFWVFSKTQMSGAIAPALFLKGVWRRD